MLQLIALNEKESLKYLSISLSLFVRLTRLINPTRVKYRLSYSPSKFFEKEEEDCLNLIRATVIHGLFQILFQTRFIRLEIYFPLRARGGAIEEPLLQQKLCNTIKDQIFRRNKGSFLSSFFYQGVASSS